MMKHSTSYPDPVAVAATFATGLLIGALNALAVVGLGILPLLATLAVMNIAAGAELILTENTVVGATSPLLALLAGGSFAGISALAWCLILFSAAMVVLIHFTGLGLRLYAVGGHREAARAAAREDDTGDDEPGQHEGCEETCGKLRIHRRDTLGRLTSRASPARSPRRARG